MSGPPADAHTDENADPADASPTRPSRHRPTRRPQAVGVPRALPAVAVLALVIVVAPLAGLVARTPWGSLGHHLGEPAARAALRLSLGSSLAATAVSAAVGVPLAWLLARVDFTGRALVRALVTLPMVLPPVVGGVALLAAFGAHGPFGRLLAHAGVHLPFTFAGVVLAETFVALPFVVVTAEAGLRQVDPRIDEAAASLGAGPWTRLLRVTLPLARPSLVAGAALCWARALGEFGATLTFAGNLPGRTQTVPLAVYGGLESTDPGGALVLSVVMLAISLAVLVVLRERWLGRT